MKKVLFRLVLIILTIGLTLTVAELFLRIAGFRYDLHLTHVQFGWPDPVQIRRYSPDPDLLWVPKDYANQITRAADSPPPMVCIGCSCTEFGTYPAALRARISRSIPESRFQFLNVGVSGWTTHQGLRQLERDVVPLRPRLVTIFFGWNDHWKNFGIEDKDIGGLMSRHPSIVSLSRLRVVQFIDWVYVRFYVQRGSEPANRVSLGDFRANLIRMVELSRNHGIVPVLLTAPSSHVEGEEPAYLAERFLVDLSTLVPVHRQYAQTVREIAAEMDVALVDLAEEFDALPRALVRDTYFRKDGIHLSPAGDRVIAEILHRRFIEEDLLPILTRKDSRNEER